MLDKIHIFIESTVPYAPTVIMCLVIFCGGIAIIRTLLNYKKYNRKYFYANIIIGAVCIVCGVILKFLTEYIFSISIDDQTSIFAIVAVIIMTLLLLLLLELDAVANRKTETYT
jgi:uncharacterized protein YacL